MHVSDASLDGVPGIEVISHSATQHQSECEVLTLRVAHSFWSLGVDSPKTEAPLKIRRNSPAASDKITTNSHIISRVVGFWSSRDRREGATKREVPIPPENPGTSYVVHLPPQ